MRRFSKGILAAVAVAGTGIALTVALSNKAPDVEPFLEEQLVAWAPSAWEPLNFCAQITRGSYDNPGENQNSLEVMQAELAFLLSLNPTSVRIDIGYDAYATGDSTVTDNIGAIVSAVKGAGKRLVIADAAREAYRKTPLPWAQFQAEWISRVGDLAARYTPDYYLVIKEPGWYVKMISDLMTNPSAQSSASWLALLGELNSAVKAVSPSTKTGISTTGNSLIPSSSPQYAFYLALMQGAEVLPSNDILGFDIYGPGDFGGTQSFLAANPPPPRQEAWIAETWSPTSGGSTPQTTIDQQWLEVAYSFALLEGMTLMNPFYTDRMCDYALSALTNPNAIISEYQTATEPSYWTYKQLIAGVLPAYG